MKPPPWPVLKSGLDREEDEASERDYYRAVARIVAFASHRLDDEMVTAVARANKSPVPYSEVARGHALHPVEPWASKAGAKRAAARRARAARKAEWEAAIKKGDLHLLARKKKGGRPKGSTSKMSDEKREATRPIHRAVRMVPVAERILIRLDPAQPKGVIRNFAKRAVSHFLGGLVTVKQLSSHMARSKNDRRRIKSS